MTDEQLPIEPSVFAATSPAMPPAMLMQLLITILQRYSFRYATEAQLHQGISEALSTEKIPFEHEKVDGANRYDFFCSGIAIEVKMDRSATQAHRQVDRYCQADQVAGVILLTTKPWYVETAQRTTVRGKPVAIVRIRGQAF